MEPETDLSKLPLPSSGKRRFRLRRLALKELRETLRDRRTIVTLILMPLLVYPILSLLFRTFLASNTQLFTPGEPIRFQIVYRGMDDQGKMLPGDVAVGSEHQLEVQARAQQLLGQIGGVIARIEKDRMKSVESENGILVSQEQTADIPESNPGGKRDSSGFESQFDNEKKNSGGILANIKTREPEFVPFREHRWIMLSNKEPRTIEQVVEEGAADLGVYLHADNDQGWQLGRVKLISRKDGFSRMAANYVQENLEIFNQHVLAEKLRAARLPVKPAIEVADLRLSSPDSEQSAAGGGFSLASLIPLILVLMTITGAVYPAIDLTAGEKERGTLEVLMAAPIPRLSILISKFVAVLTVAVLTALLNIIGMAATVWAFQLDQFLPDAAQFTVLVVFKIFLLLVLFAAFFSALLLAVTSYARSFKEAQAYLIPIILLSMGPGLLAMTPGLTLSGPWAVTPMVNLLLLARDVIQNQVEWVPAVVAIVTTLIYASLAIMLAATSFGSDAILYQTHGSFGEMFSRPAKVNIFVPLKSAVFCALLLFPLNFILIGILGRMPVETPDDLGIRFGLMGVFTFFSFLLFPLLVAKHQRTEIVSGFGLNFPRALFFVSAFFLGISLWPIVMTLVSGWHDVYGWLAGVEKSDAWHDRLVEETSAQVAKVRMVSPWLIGLCLAIIPAICEEWFFRGMLLRSLLRARSAAISIGVSSVVFGLFHVLSNSVIAVDRLVPTTLVGLMLGYLAYKSNSILPGILLHAIHNAAVSFLAYYQPQLSQFSWFPAESQEVPIWWVALAVTVAVVAIGLIVRIRPAASSRQ